MLNVFVGPLTEILPVPGVGPMEPISVSSIIPVWITPTPEEVRLILNVFALGFGPRPVSVAVMTNGAVAA